MMERPNIVCLILDSARAESLSCYGGDAKTPNIDDLADGGALFENAFAPATWTVPTHASLFTGVYPSEHGTDKGNRFLNPNYPTLAEKLSDVGYTTVLYSNNIHLTEQFGFDRGFDIVESSHAVSTGEDLIDWNDFLKNRKHESGVKKYVEVLKHIYNNRDKNIRESLEAASRLKYNHHYGDNGASETNKYLKGTHFEEPYFIVVNYMEAHNPFRPPHGYSDQDPPEVTGWKYKSGIQSLSNEELETLEHLYNAELEYLDTQIGDIRGAFDDENTVLTVTSDHGVALGEHGLLYHGDALYNPIVKVPLIISGAETSGRIPYSTSVIGLHETYLSLAGLNSEDYVRGTDLLELSEHDTVYMEYQGQQEDILEEIRRLRGDEVANRYDAPAQALVKGRYKYIQSEYNDKVEVYNYWEDPEEVSPISAQSVVSKLKQEIDTIEKSLSPRKNDGKVGDIGGDVEDRLEELGYIT